MLQLDPVPGQPALPRVDHLPALAADLAAALDPAIFARRAGIEPDPWQCDVLRSPARQMLLCCSRQSGKSTIVACLAVHQALYTPSSLILVFSPGLRQSIELFRKIAHFYRVAETPDPEAESLLRLELPNGSRIVALPGDPATVRGFSAPALVIVDEAAFTQDELRFGEHGCHLDAVFHHRLSMADRPVIPRHPSGPRRASTGPGSCWGPPSRCEDRPAPAAASPSSLGGPSASPSTALLPRHPYPDVW